MPSRHTRKLDLANSTFHVYSRGRDRQPIVRDNEDRAKLIECFTRHLSKIESVDSKGRAYRRLSNEVRLATFTIMFNHFHLIIHQISSGGMERLVQAALNGYVQYFNAKYGLSGPLFSGEYRARRLENPGQIKTAIAYVHDNHGSSCQCKFCSNRFYTGDPRDVPSWLEVSAALDVFGGKDEYQRFRDVRATMRAMTYGS